MAIRPGGFMSNRFDLQTAEPADPAVSVGLSWPVPANSVIKLISLTALITLVAGAPNRFPLVCIQNDGTLILPQSPSITQTGLTAWQHNWSIGITDLNASVADNAVWARLGDDYFAKTGEFINLDIVGIQAGDQISNIEIRYLAWAEG